MAYIGKTPTIGNFQVCDAISVVNNQAAYTMQVGGVNVSPESANHMLVSLNGILQAPTSSFTVSGSTITFASNLVTGDVIDFIQILGNVLDLGVPSDGTVTSAKINYPLTTFSSTGIDDNATSTAVTIDSSGNLLVGKTSPTSSTVGIEARDGGFLLATRSGGNPLMVNRTSSDGDIIQLRKDNTTVGSIDVSSSGIGIYLGGTGTANKLDDYEEGTWSPVINGTTFSNRGYYTKVGRMCSIHFGDVTNPAVALSNGSDYAITGLPFSQIGSGWEYASTPTISYADASGGYKSFPLTGRQRNDGAIHVANRSGQDVTSSDPLNLAMVYTTN